jgi:DNA-binding NarL/FixJ family response regulator
VNASPNLRPGSRPGDPTGTAGSASLSLDERQRRLLALLLAGHTDTSAASRLGVSPRTVTNILRLLMDRLGVHNRFQLGVALGSRMRPDGGQPLGRAPVRPVTPELSIRP